MQTMQRVIPNLRRLSRKYLYYYSIRKQSKFKIIVIGYVLLRTIVPLRPTDWRMLFCYSLINVILFYYVYNGDFQIFQEIEDISFRSKFCRDSLAAAVNITMNTNKRQTQVSIGSFFKARSSCKNVGWVRKVD